MKKILVLSISVLMLTSFNSCTAEQNTEDLQTNIMQINTYEITAADVNEKIKNAEDFHLIDVRTPEENAELKIPNSKLMVLNELADTIINDEEIAFNDEIVVYCRSGNRSKTAYDILTQLGYTNVKSMSGGINEWENLGYNTCSELNKTC